MINPIQQNVVFKGVNANSVNGKADNFTGAPAVTTSVREGYLNAIDNVSKVQDTMKNKVDGTLGKNLNVIA